MIKNKLIIICIGFFFIGAILIAAKIYNRKLEEVPKMVKISNNESEKTKVDVWLSTIDQSKLLEKQQSIKFTPTKGESKYTINIDETKTYQQMDGFGASFTDTSAWLVYNKLSESGRKELMTKLFDRNNGIGISFLRQPMGASDFALSTYSYDDMPKGQTDFELKNFSIEHDKKYIIPILQEALSIDKDIKIMATPWSPPGWMKFSDNMIGGSLRPDSYNAYANYFLKFINSYSKEGIPIYAISIQNEPMYVPEQYPGMKMMPEEQIAFVKNALGPIFENNNIKTKIMVYDHNWDLPSYPKVIFKDKEASKYIAGSAWHSYGGTHDAMTDVHDSYPNKDIWFTEASGGQWVAPFHDAFMDEMMHVIRSTRNWSKSVVWWNMALDQNNGPSLLNKSTCRGVVTIDQSTGKVNYNLDYYTMGHISKFVTPGAYRIDSNTFNNAVEDVAFKNPDGSKVLIVSNRTKENKTIRVRCGKEAFDYTLLGECAVTFTWN